MKAHFTKVPVAFLFAAFVLGCQDLGSGPVGPDGLVPQFHADHTMCEGHKKKDAGCDDPPPIPPRRRIRPERGFR